MLRPLLCALALTAALPAAAQLSSAERKIAAAVDAGSAETLALLERMVNQNSGTLNLAGVRAMGAMLRPEFEKLGFAVKWIDVPETQRAGHFVATHKGNGRGKRILLIAHIDTVFEATSPFQKYRREGDKAIGPGVVDDKGGIAVILAALRAMDKAGTLRNADIQVMLTGDEEKSGDPIPLARRDLIEAGKWADIALEFENLAREDGRDFGTVARRSANNWTLTATGKTGHGGGVFGPETGYGAVYEIARILDAWRSELIEENLTFNVGVIGGGTPATIDKDGVRIEASGKTNVVPATAIARGDLRSLTPEQDAAARAKMQAIVAQHLPGTGATLSFQDNTPPMAPTEGNRALLARLNKANRDLGLPEMAEYPPAKRGAADSSFVAAWADTLAGMGPSGGTLHAEGEWLDIPSIALQARRSAILMSRLAQEKR
ncbi:glutamate carboxypeptidase [Sphingomonas naasensis]|uniref:M20 family peptidase n=1 Tax=Sphingomonas naasensis TaxID=1344951 RepID=A0A4S1WA75_9SPHN|nr:M20/M25/M40 family metallo-hydrolase [Sphingomonas naasensis]NIJ19582.1 glutamate carboxypeptidase [Sphingomonas naasensis]TGX39313.1 M20 family peptidase [Sphingomonas naasensis]